MNIIEKNLNQKSITLSHIKLYMNKVKLAIDEEAKYRMINKTVGILSLARTLDIITLEEYEHFFKELYN